MTSNNQANLPSAVDGMPFHSSTEAKDFLVRNIGKLLPLFDVHLWHQLMTIRRRRSFFSSCLLALAGSTLCVYLFFALFLPLFVFQPVGNQQISSSRHLILSASFQRLQPLDENVSSNNETNDNETYACPESDKEICVFRQIILPEEDRRLLTRTLTECSKILNNLSGTSYFLYGTSLLGWYRHNKSYIPWDDFVNIALYQTDPKLTTAMIVRSFHRLLKNLTKEYSLRYDRDQKIIKFYGVSKSNSRRIPHNPKVFWRWPYVEIQVMNVTFDDDNKIVNLDDPNWEDYSYPGELIHPVTPTVFEGTPGFVPREPVLALERNYNPDTCSSPYYNHRTEDGVDSELVVSKPCYDLRHFISFTNIELTNEKLETGEPDCEIGRQADDPLLCAFLPQITPAERENIVQLFKICVEMLEQLKDAKYFLYGGTLIGYWRHNGTFIPWDDDVDIAVIRTSPRRKNSYFVKSIRRMIANYPGYGMHYIESQGKLKVFGTYANNSRRIGQGGSFSWRWPFVDIQLMKTTFSNDGELVNVSDTSGFDSYWYPGHLIMPLKRATFESTQVYVPSEIQTVLNRNYDIRYCTAPYYSHRFEEAVADERQVSRPCLKLTSLYTFTNIADEYYDDGSPS